MDKVQPLLGCFHRERLPLGLLATLAIFFKLLVVAYGSMPASAEMLAVQTGHCLQSELGADAPIDVPDCPCGDTCPHFLLGFDKQGLPSSAGAAACRLPHHASFEVIQSPALHAVHYSSVAIRAPPRV
ncbi:hypothetical protein E1162_15940 [Rhodobacteraceae bacterium RKSG542]|uniref:hypothetical protein n=1 Tax=Pseudovibrio flavus TaxID=2529854 RepID=UPI0012BD5A73|nr:hypothetical protein [Pseudovibrio flavus]MTI18737.1 hypothetical protein [Pseudovibrio flavus]